MVAKDFRAWAREMLRGHWPVAVGVMVVAALLGGGIDLLSTVNSVNVAVGAEGGLLNSIPRETLALFTTITAVSGLLVLILGGAISMGVCTFNLNLAFHREARFMDLFSHFHRLWTGICMQFMVGLLVFLWSLLFLVPGIMASFSYAMVPFLLAEFPDLGVMNAIKESKRIMRGNRWRLFCMEISFLGWSLLSSFTMGIGSLFLNPYMRAAHAAFYLEITGRGQVRQSTPRMNPQGF